MKRSPPHSPLQGSWCVESCSNWPALSEGEWKALGMGFLSANCLEREGKGQKCPFPLTSTPEQDLLSRDIHGGSWWRICGRCNRFGSQSSLVSTHPLQKPHFPCIFKGAIFLPSCSAVLCGLTFCCCCFVVIVARTLSLPL